MDPSCRHGPAAADLVAMTCVRLVRMRVLPTSMSADRKGSDSGSNAVGGRIGPLRGGAAGGSEREVRADPAMRSRSGGGAGALHSPNARLGRRGTRRGSAGAVRRGSGRGKPGSASRSRSAARIRRRCRGGASPSARRGRRGTRREGAARRRVVVDRERFRTRPGCRGNGEVPRAPSKRNVRTSINPSGEARAVVGPVAPRPVAVTLRRARCT